MNNAFFKLIGNSFISNQTRFCIFSLFLQKSDTKEHFLSQFRNFSDGPLAYPLKALIFYTLNTPLSSNQLHLHIFCSSKYFGPIKVALLHPEFNPVFSMKVNIFVYLNAFDFIYCICTWEGWNFVNWELLILFPLGFVTWYTTTVIRVRGNRVNGVFI